MADDEDAALVTMATGQTAATQPTSEQTLPNSDVRISELAEFCLEQELKTLTATVNVTF